MSSDESTNTYERRVYALKQDLAQVTRQRDAFETFVKDVAHGLLPGFPQSEAQSLLEAHKQPPSTAEDEA